MPQNHAQSLRERKPMSRRTKLSLWAGTGIVIAAAVVAILLTATGSKIGCLDTNLAGAMGAEPLHECGQAARQTCATVKENEKQFGAVGVLNISNACRKGHLSVS